MKPFHASAGHICVTPDFLMRLLDDLSRYRALADDETDLLEALVDRGHQTRGIRIQWTATMDLELLKAASMKGGVTEFARLHEISRQAAYDRCAKLRKANKTTARKVG